MRRRPYHDASNRYFSAIWGRKFLTDLYRSSYVDSDSISKRDVTYSLNTRGYRSGEFSKDTDLVVAGCSYTYGMGLSYEHLWWNVLADKLGYTRSNISTPGASIPWIVDRLFEYFSEFGDPKYLICLFPDTYRTQIPADGIVVVSDQEESETLWVDRKTLRKKHIANVHLNKLDKAPFYHKNPIEAKEILTPDYAEYYVVRALRHLEQYCKAAKIKLLWSTWDSESSDKFSYFKDIESMSFNNYVDINLFYSRKYLSDSTAKDVFYSTKSELAVCQEAHGERIDCSCYDSCHLDDTDLTALPQFDCALDKTFGLERAHYGIHAHMHIAEGFYSHLMR